MAARIPRGDAAGCDIGGTSIQLVALRRGRAIERRDLPTPRAPGDAIAAIADGIDSLRATARRGARAFSPSAVGLAFCGVLNPRRTRVDRSTHLPAYEGVALAARVKKRVGIPVHLDADTNAGAVGEALVGAGRGHSRLLYVSLGTGVGAALVADGEPVRASHHTAGQIAELPLPNPSTRRRTRVESALSERGIVAAARREGVRVRNGEELFRFAQEGDPAARRTWRAAGTHLGDLLAILVPLWSPDRVVIGGGTSGAGELLLHPARRALTRALASSRTPPPIARAEFGRYGGAIGAAILALHAATGSSTRGGLAVAGDRRRL